MRSPSSTPAGEYSEARIARHELAPLRQPIFQSGHIRLERHDVACCRQSLAARRRLPQPATCRQTRDGDFNDGTDERYAEKRSNPAVLQTSHPPFTVSWICIFVPVRLRWITYLLSTNLARPVPNLFKLYVLTKTDLRIRIGDRLEILYNEIDSTAPAVGQLAPNILIPLVQNGN